MEKGNAGKSWNWMLQGQAKNLASKAGEPSRLIENKSKQKS